MPGGASCLIALRAAVDFCQPADIQVQKRALANEFRDVIDPIAGVTDNSCAIMAVGFQRVHVESHLHRALAGPSGATSATLYSTIVSARRPPPPTCDEIVDQASSKA